VAGLKTKKLKTTTTTAAALPATNQLPHLHDTNRITTESFAIWITSDTAIHGRYGLSKHDALRATQKHDAVRTNEPIYSSNRSLCLKHHYNVRDLILNVIEAVLYFRE